MRPLPFPSFNTPRHATQRSRPGFKSPWVQTKRPPPRACMPAILTPRPDVDDAAADNPDNVGSAANVAAAADVAQ
jgi:hypothetical protein